MERSAASYIDLFKNFFLAASASAKAPGESRKSRPEKSEGTCLDAAFWVTVLEMRAAEVTAKMIAEIANFIAYVVRSFVILNKLIITFAHLKT